MYHRYPCHHFNFLLLAILAHLWLAACSGADQQQTDQANNPQEAGRKAYNAIPEKVVGLAKVEPEGRAIRLYPQVAGPIEHAFVKAGVKVRKGQVLFEIEHDLEDAKIGVIQAQEKSARASIRSIQANLQKARAAIANAERAYRRSLEVFDKGAGTKQELDNAETAWTTARFDQAAVQANLENAEARLDELLANLRLAQVGREKYFVRAPADGVLLDSDGVDGAMVGPGVALCEFAPEGPTSVLSEIDELFADQVKLDQPAYIRLQGGNDTIATGYVVEISPSLRQKSLFAEEIGRLEDRRVRKVRVRLETGQGSLLYGQRVECLIDVKHQQQ